MSIKTNLERAIAVMDATPEESINLRHYTCGSCHCALGWLALDPYFNDLGIHLDHDGNVLPHKMLYGQTLTDLFGENSQFLFLGYGDGDKDSRLLSAITGESYFKIEEMLNKHGRVSRSSVLNVSDKELALARLTLRYLEYLDYESWVLGG